MRGIDTYKSCADIGGEIVAAGFGFVARYLSDGASSSFHEDFPASEAAHLGALGLRLVSICEHGRPDGDHPEYFTTAQAQANVLWADSMARHAGQPQGTVIYHTVDGDLPVSVVQAYCIAMHNGLKNAGYLTGIYGSGAVCQWAIEDGYAHVSWLAESTGWSEYQWWRSKADIVQVVQTTMFGIDVDTNLTNVDNFGFWTP